jgi:predicted Rossmann fold flavoprotein
MTDFDVVIVGAGAAGLMAGIWAGRTRPHARIVILDGAKTLGAKILVAGGGRCNVTHDHIDESVYFGSSRNAIKKVLRQLDVPQTIAFFAELGVTLKREETGKLFPTTDDARTVLNALLKGAKQAGVSIQHPKRVDTLVRNQDNFLIRGAWGAMSAQRVILATGGRSLPKSGSDGHGYTLAQHLGHSLTEHIFPALVPLTLPASHFIPSLSGLTVPTTLTVCDKNGKKIMAFTDSTLCTHFGLSGPSVLDISRHYIAHHTLDPQTQLFINWIPSKTTDEIDSDLQKLGAISVGRYLGGYMPERLARALCQEAQLEASASGHTLTRDKRRNLANIATHLRLPITGNRGYTYAEVTGGGVPLSEIELGRMASRMCDGLHLCGEICDVDGRIGGYNFQWAWASGYLAGRGAFFAG